MKGLLAVVGAVLVLDALVAALMMALWAAKGHVPDFLQLTAFGVASMVAVLVKVGLGPLAAAQLWRRRPSGPVLGGVVTITNMLHTILAAVQAGAIGRGAVWLTVGLNAAMLLVVALPAARRACHAR